MPIVFTVYNLGFVARCALEEEDAAEFRLSKIGSGLNLERDKDPPSPVLP